MIIAMKLGLEEKKPGFSKGTQGPNGSRDLMSALGSAMAGLETLHSTLHLKH